MNWYNCWLAHSWAPWTDTRIRVRDVNYGFDWTGAAYSEWRPADGQERTCSACAMKQIRAVR